MTFYQAYHPDDYQVFFFRQIGLSLSYDSGQERLWKNPGTGSLHIFGSMDQIQTGFGNYTIPADFLVENHYESVYLHFGVIYEGITYSVVDNKLHPMAIPSSFVAIEKASYGVNRWKQGQHFMGIELSVDFRYLEQVLLPVLGYDRHALDFLQENVRYMPLPEEMRSLLLRLEQLLNNHRMTDALQTSITLELIALLLHPDHRPAFCHTETAPCRYLQIGERSIRFTQEDFQKVVRAHALITEHAASFPSIYFLSKTLKISEQKLKAGFFEVYQQTPWDYSNNVRMQHAVELLHDTDQSISEIAHAVGYQSQAAFHQMFKKWSGITPHRFRLQLQSDADGISPSE